MRKPFLTIALIVVMIFAMSAGVFAGEFSDIEEGAWYEKYVEDAVDAGIAKGYPDGTFRPEGSVTRAEMVSMINRALDLKFQKDNTFTDSENGDWYDESLNLAAYAQYVNGYPDGSFGADRTITRQEAATIIGRVITQGDYEGISGLLSFKDYDEIADWAREAIGLAYNKDYFRGYPDMYFMPEGELKRSEAVAMVMRIYNGETIIRDKVSLTSNADALKGKIYTGGVEVDEATHFADFTVDDCKIFSPMTINDGFNSDTFSFTDSVICELYQKDKDGVSLYLNGDTQIYDLYIEGSADVYSAGDGNRIDNTVIDSKDDADDFSVDFSCNAGVIDIESPVLFRWYGQTADEVNVNARSDVEIYDGVIKELNVDARGTNVYLQDPASIEILNANKTMFLDFNGDNAPDVINIAPDTTVYVPAMPGSGTVINKADAETSKIVVVDRLPAPIELAVTEDDEENVTLTWTAPTLPEDAEIAGYNVYCDGEPLGFTEETSMDITEAVAEYGSTHELTVVAVTDNEFYMDSNPSAALTVYRLTQAEFSVKKDDTGYYLLLNTDAQATAIKVTDGTGEEIAANDGKYYLTDLELIDCDITAKLTGGANVLSSTSQVTVDTLSTPSILNPQVVEDPTYKMRWSMSLPDALHTVNFQYIWNDGEGVIVENDQADVDIDYDDESFQGYLVYEIDQVIENYDQNKVDVIAQGDEVRAEEYFVGNNEVLYVSSAVGSDTVQIFAPLTDSQMSFDKDATRGEYDFSWSEIENANSYKVVTRVVTGGEVVANTNETVLTNTEDESISANAFELVTIHAQGNGGNTIAGSELIYQLYKAQGLDKEDIGFDPLTSELSWSSSPTDRSYMPKGYSEDYAVRVTNLTDNSYTTIVINEDDLTVPGFSVDDPAATDKHFTLNLLENDTFSAFIQDGVPYSVQVINIGDPTYLTYGELFAANPEDLDQQFTYGTYSFDIVKMQGPHYTEPEVTLEGAKVTITGEDAQGLNPEINTVVYSDENGKISLRLPYGEYNFAVEYADAPAGDTLESAYMIREFGDQENLAVNDIDFTVDQDALNTRVELFRNPKMALDRAQNLVLTQRDNGAGGNAWFFAFDVANGADRYYMVPWGINLDADDVAADGGILGLGVNDTTLVESGPYPIMASPVDGDVDYDSSTTNLTIKKLDSVDFDGFVKNEDGTYTVSWNYIQPTDLPEDVDFDVNYRVSVDGGESYTWQDEDYYTFTMPDDGDVEISVVATTLGENDVADNYPAFYGSNERTVTVAENPNYWNAYVYIDSDEESTTITKEDAPENFILKYNEDETGYILDWDDVEGAPGYDVQYYDTEWSDFGTTDISEIDIDNQSGNYRVSADGNYSDESVTPPYYADSAYAEAMVYQSDIYDLQVTGDNKVTWSDDALAYGELTYTVTFTNRSSGEEYTETITVPQRTAEEGYSVTVDFPAEVQSGAYFDIKVTSELNSTARIMADRDGSGDSATQIQMLRIPTYVRDAETQNVLGGAQVTVSKNGKVLYDKVDVSKNGVNLYLMADANGYDLEVEGFTADTGVVYQSVATYTGAVNETYPAAIFIDVAPEDYLALYKSESAILNVNEANEALYDISVQEVTKGLKAGEETDEVGNVTYELFGVEGTNGQRVSLGTATAVDGYATFSGIDIAAYDYLVSVASTDATNSVSSELVMNLSALAEPQLLPLERDTENNLVLRWSPVENAVNYSVNGVEQNENFVIVANGESYEIQALGNVGDEVAANAYGVVNFYFDSNITGPVTADVTAIIPVKAFDNKGNAIEGNYSVVNDDTQDALADSAYLPAGGTNLVLTAVKDGNYTAYFSTNAFDPRTYTCPAISFTVENGLVSVDEIRFVATPDEEYVNVPIEVFGNNIYGERDDMVGTEVTLTRVENKAGEAVSEVPYTYENVAGENVIRLLEGEYTVTINDQVVKSFTVNEGNNQHGVVTVDLSNRGIPVNVYDATNGNVLNDAEVTITDINNADNTWTGKSGETVYPANGNYTVTVEDGFVANNITYVAYENTVDITAESPNEIRVELARAESTVLDPSASAALEIADRFYIFEIQNVTTANNGTVPVDVKSYELYGVLPSGITEEINTAFTAYGDDSQVCNVAVDVASQYKSFILKAIPADNVVNGVASETKITINTLDAPVFSPVYTETSTNETVLPWDLVPNADHYLWKIGDRSGEVTAPALVGVEDGDEVSVQSIGNVGMAGRSAEMVNADIYDVINFYLDSDVATTTIEFADEVISRDVPMIVVGKDGQVLSDVHVAVTDVTEDNVIYDDIVPANGTNVTLIPGHEYRVVSARDYVDANGVAYNRYTSTFTATETEPALLYVKLVPTEGIEVPSSSDMMLSLNQNQSDYTLYMKKVTGVTDPVYTVYGMKDDFTKDVINTANTTEADYASVVISEDQLAQYSYLLVEITSSDANSIPSQVVVAINRLATPVIDNVVTDEQTGELALTWGSVTNATGYTVNGEEVDGCTYKPVENGEYTVIALGNLDEAVNVVGNMVTFYLDSEAVTETVEIPEPSTVVTVPIIVLDENGNSVAQDVWIDGARVNVPAGGLKYEVTFAQGADSATLNIGDLEVDGYNKIDGTSYTITETSPAVILLQLVPVEKTQLPVSEDMQLSYDGGQSQYTLSMKKVTSVTNPVYKVYGVKDDLSEEEITVTDSTGSDYASAVITANSLDTYRYLRVEISSSDDNTIPSQVIVTIDQLLTPVIGNVVTDAETGQNVLTWGAVTNATGYTVNDGVTDHNVTGCSYQPVTNGDYSVIALGNMNVPVEVVNNSVVFYLDSEAATKTVAVPEAPEEPTVVTVPIIVLDENGNSVAQEITVNNELATVPTGGLKYDVTFEGEATEATLTIGAINVDGYQEIAEQTYTITETSPAAILINLVPVEKTQVANIETVRYAVVSGGYNLTVGKIPGDSSDGTYTYTLKGVTANSEQKLIETVNSSADSGVTFEITTANYEAYQYFIVEVSSTEANTVPSRAAVSFEKLDAPIIANVERPYSWYPVNNATGYMVNYSTDVATDLTIRYDKGTTSADLADLQSATIYALGNADTDVQFVNGSAVLYLDSDSATIK